MKADFEGTQDSLSKTRAGSARARLRSDNTEKLTVSRSVFAASWDPYVLLTRDADNGCKYAL